MPTYRFRCDAHGDLDIYRSMFDDRPEPRCPTCKQALQRVYTMPYLTASATPTSRPLTFEANQREKHWSKDMDAYRRLRQDGTQPAQIDGSARLEAGANTNTEITMGKLMPTRLVKRGVEISRDVTGNDLEV